MTWQTLWTGLLMWSISALRAADGTGAEAVAFVPPDRSLSGTGRYVYERNCSVCHGERGDGRGEMADSLLPKPRSFRAGNYKYRSTPWGKLPTTDDLIHTIRQGRTGTAMGMFTYLTDAETRAVTEYVKLFSRKWWRPENHAVPIVIPPEPDWLQKPIELARRAAAGREVYLAHCAVCHGEAADGRGIAAATLKDELGEPAIPADLRQPRLRSGNELRDIYRVLVTGLNGTPMMSFAETLMPEQKWDVIAYIQTLRAQQSARR